MAGLDLISTYSSESEDEEKNEELPDGKVIDHLPLPQSIVKWEGVPHHEDVIDDEKMHDGRKRSFKHERGNWASLVYINYEPSEDMHKWMISVLKKLPVKCNTLFENLHISLSRTLILKFHWIQSFTNDIKKLCGQLNQFTLEFSNLRVYCNDEKTRTFLGLECIDRSGTLQLFMRNINILLKEYGLPPFYEDGSFHISFLWCLGDETKQLGNIEFLESLGFNEFLAQQKKDRYISVNEIHFKSGNKTYGFNLK